MAVQTPLFADDQAYPAWYVRKLMAGYASPGIASPTDFTVSPLSGLQVQISAGTAFVQQTVNIEGSSAYNGVYMCVSDAAVNPFNTISAPITNPRIDQVILRVYDVKEQTLSGTSFARIEWLAGSENGSASLSTMGFGLSNPGAATLPANSLRLAYVLATVGEGSISSGSIKNVAPQATAIASGTSAQRPVSAQDGAIFHATDANVMSFFSSALSSWNSFLQFSPSEVSASTPAKAGQLITVIGAGVNIALPAPSSVPLGSMVRLWNNSGTAVSPTTVSVSGGANIIGQGVLGTTSWVMGTFGQSCLFVLDAGGFWRCVSGQYDTGWVPLTIGTGGQTIGSNQGRTPPAYHRVGNVVKVNGVFETNGSLGTSVSFTSLPSPANSTFAPVSVSSGLGASASINWSIVGGGTTLSVGPLPASGIICQINGEYPLD